MHHTASKASASEYNSAIARHYYIGQYRHDVLKSGIQIHGGRTRYRISTDKRALVDPCISFVFLLKGSLRFSLGGQFYQFEAGEHGRCIMLSLSEAEVLRRIVEAGKRVDKLVIRGIEGWLNEADSSTKLFTQIYQQRVRDWPMTSSMRQCSEQWLLDSDSQNLLQKDLLGLTLMNLVWQHYLSRCHVEDTGQHMLDKARAQLKQRLETAMDAGIFDAQQLAEELSLSLRTLQRRCHELLACTLKSWITTRRLERAKKALLEEQKTISEAAWLAGYSHVSNFIQAFKREFHTTPKVFIESYHQSQN